MKIVHICLCGTVTDGFTYQDNLLSKYHRRLGYDVTLIASHWIRGTDGNYAIDERTEYINADGVKMIRLDFHGRHFDDRLKVYLGLYQAIEQEHPDILFVHGCQFRDIRVIVRYKKSHPEVRIYVDNHADYSNSGRGWISKNILHRIIWRHYAQMIAPYAEKFYGVMPARVDFLTELYGLKSSQCDLLVMGADDDMVKRAARSETRERTRRQYHITADDFLIVTGGKINLVKKQTLYLMQAVQNINNPHLRLVVFGPVVDELKAQVNSLADGNKVQYIGWMNAEQSYDLFAVADLAVFPGRHSVYWEQVTGQGIPMLVKDWDGTHHVDVGGNVRFLTQDSTEEIQNEIQNLLDHPEQYQQMKDIAVVKGMQTFSYLDIARRSIM